MRFASLCVRAHPYVQVPMFTPFVAEINFDPGNVRRFSSKCANADDPIWGSCSERHSQADKTPTLCFKDIEQVGDPGPLSQ